MSSDTRKTRIWRRDDLPSPMHQPVVDEEPETRVPCPIAGEPCPVCGAPQPGAHGDVPASVRRSWRAERGYPLSSVPADRFDKEEP